MTDNLPKPRAAGQTVASALLGELAELLTRHGATMADLAAQVLDASAVASFQRRVDEATPPELLDAPAMRRALARRDIAEVFRLLQRRGVSQRRIAALTGVSQSEVSEILGNRHRRGRHVASVDVLTRIMS